MAIETIFLGLGVILFIGFFGEIIFEKTKIPDVIWLMVIGIVLGSFTGLVTSTDLVSIAPIFTTFALIFLLFEAGLNIDIMQFLKSLSQGSKLTITSFIFSFIAIFLIGFMLQLGLYPSLLLGTILAGVSSAVVLPIVKNLHMTSDTRLSLVFDSAFSDVLCILGTVTLLEIIVFQSADAGAIAGGLLSSFLIAIALGAALAFAWAKLIWKYFKSRGNFYVLTLAFMLILYSGTELLKANGAIACLVFGLFLGNSQKAAALLQEKGNVITKSGKEFYAEIAFFIKTFFFVYLGILIDFSDPWSFLWGFLILIGLYLARPFAVFLSFKRSTPVKDVRVTEVLVPKGLAAAVLVQLPIQAGVAGAEALVNICLAVILLSILASTVFTVLVQKGKFKGVFPFLQKKYSDYS